MPDIIGIDHIYITVSDLTESESFYDGLLLGLGFRKNRFQLEQEDHIQYYNRHFGCVLRPSRSRSPHDAYSPGLHHLCFRVNSEEDVDEVFNRLEKDGYELSKPRYFQDYAPDYYAVFLKDPDGIQVEITNYRKERRERHDNWENS